MHIKIGKIPFVFAPIKTCNNPYGIPNSLDFFLEEQDGVIRQAKTKETEQILDKVYRLGSIISGQMDDFGNGKEYGDEFLEYICKNMVEIKHKKILEIGCGTGYLLSKLQNLGADCIGVEPGESAVYGMGKFGVDIVQNFFDKDLFQEKFDYIIFYCVLEHIYETKKFLNDVKSLLKFGGKIFLAVPNCGKQILSGDISMLFMEHWSYYTEKSLKLTALHNGLSGEISISAEGGRALFANLYDNENLELKIDIKAKSGEDENCQLQKFIENFHILKEKLINFFYKLKVNDEVLAIYVPGRLINWLNIINENILFSKMRFIDDNCLLQGTFYPGFKNPIESLDEYLKNPTEKLLIASYTYEDRIKSKLEKRGYHGEILSIRELFQ